MPVREMAEVLKLASQGIGNNPAVAAMDVAAARLARQLARSGRRIIGLLPAGAKTDVTDLALPLGIALGVILGHLVVVLDPEQIVSRKIAGKGTPPPVPPAGGNAPLVYACTLAPNLVAIAPYARAPAGAKAEAIKALLAMAEKRREAYEIALVDMTGCVHPGELLESLSIVDGIIIVGKAGRVSANELSVAAARIPEELSIGVILTD